MTGELKSKAIKSMFWSGVDTILGQVIQFFIAIVMARLLSPSDYGVIGIVSIFTAIATLFRDSGFCSALIQKKNRSNTDYSTVFIFNLIASIIIYAVFWAVAPAIATFFEIPVLVTVIRVITITFIIGSFSTVQTVKLQIELDFKLLTKVSVVSMVATGAVGIYLAYRGWGVWALVWQTVFASVLRLLMLTCCNRWFPGVKFSRQSFVELFSFGSKLLLANIINTIYNNISTIFVGKFCGPADLGYYSRAQGYANLPGNTFEKVIVSVNYPVLVKLRDNKQQMIDAYRAMMQGPMCLLLAVLFGIAALAEPLIVVMIGEKWLPCVPLLRVLCFAAMFAPLSNINLSLIYVMGRSDLTLKLELVKKPIAFVLISISSFFGVLWMCVAVLVYAIFAFYVNCYYTKKILDYGLMKQVKVLQGSLVNGLLMSMVVYYAVSLLPIDWIKLVVGVPLGVCVFSIAEILAKDEAFVQMERLIASRLRRS